MNIGKIILGVVLLALIPTHWFLGGVVLSALTGISGILIVAVWLMLLLAGVSLILAGLNEPDVIVQIKKDTR